ncbi:hypothetical protein TrST_g4793 [Triparma strigata]|nr:hypothetical protein TrST_g4793 [Triparma strigata]
MSTYVATSRSLKDDAVADKFFISLIDERPEMARNERNMMNNMLELGCSGISWKRIKNTHTSHISKYKGYVSQKERTMLAGKASGRVSASSTQLLASVVNFASWEKLQKHSLVNGNLPRERTVVPDSCSHILSYTMALHPPLRNRIFKMWSTWDMQVDSDGLRTCYFAWCPFEDMEVGMYSGETFSQLGSFISRSNLNLNNLTDESGSVGNSYKSLKNDVEAKAASLSESAKNIINGNEVPARSSGLYVFRELAPNVTFVTLINLIDLKGHLPALLMDLKLTETLKSLDNMRKRHSRDTEKVDSEVREHMKKVFARDRQDDQILSETDDMWERCYEMRKFQAQPKSDRQRVSSYSPARLLSSIGKRKEYEPWRAMDSPCALTKMERRKNLTLSNGNNLVTECRASCICDCSAEDAMAYLWDACSDTRLKGGRESSLKAHLDKSLALYVDQHDRVFEPAGGAGGGRNDVVAVLKKLPWPLKKIEFVFSRTWRKIGDGYGIAVESVDNRVNADYGTVMKHKVRGFMQALILIEPTQSGTASLESCNLKLFQVLNVGRRHNYIRLVDSNKHIFESFVKQNAIKVRKTFEKDKIIDQLGRDQIKSVIADDQTGCTEEEEDFLDNIHDQLDITGSMAFDTLPTPDMHVNARILLRGTYAIIRATTVLEATIDDASAYEFAPSSRGKLKYFIEQHGKDRNIVYINPHSYIQMKRFEIPLYKQREFVQRYVLKKSEDEAGSKNIEIGIDSVQHNLFPETNQYIRSIGTSLFIFEKLPPLFGIPQTKMSYVAKMTWGGLVPGRFVRVKAQEGLAWILSMRKTFDKKKTLDALERKQFIEKLHLNSWGHATSSSAAAYTDEEKKDIEVGQEFFRIFQNNPTKKRVASSSASVINEIAFRKNDASGWGLSETKIRAKKEDILAFLWNVDANCCKHVADIERLVLERHNAHHQIAYLCRAAAVKGYSPRYSVSRMVWAEVADGSLVVVHHPCGHSKEEEQQNDDGRKRVDFSSICKVKETLDPSICKLTYIYHSVGDKQLSMMTHMKQMMELVYDVKSYFLQLRVASDLEDDDGRMLGEALSHASDSTVDSCFRSYRALQEMDDRFPWFKPMIVAVLNNSLHMAPAIDSKLVFLSEDDGHVIGSGLALPIAINLTNDAAVEEWLARYPALKEFGRGGDGEKWFIPMIEVIAARLLSSAAWGMTTRVLIGGGVSLLDFASDLYMIKLYREDPDNLVFSYLMIGMVGLCCLLQLGIVTAQNWKAPLHIKIREMLYVICFVKPAVDAYRVATGNVQSRHSMASPVLEMMAVRCVELFAESLPSACLATYVVINGESSFAALASILISALSAGYTCASISYDLDTNPDQRLKAPTFYGFLHDDAYKRSICFVCMVMLSALLLIAKSLTTGLLMSVSLKAFLLENAVEFSLFFLYKVYNMDVVHPFRTEGIFMTVLFSLCIPIGTKVISDYTGLVFFRHPNFLGGFWSINMVLTFIGMIFATILYSEGSVGGVAGGGVDADTDTAADFENTRVLRITTVITSCLSLWLLTFLIFLKSINESHIKSFFNHETSKSYVQSFFNSPSDSTKIVVLSYNARVWKEIRPDVKSWIAVNWTQWNYERPLWFTSSFKDFDGDLVPESSDKFNIMKRKFEMQRSSMKITVQRIGRMTVDHGRRGGEGKIFPKGEERGEERGEIKGGGGEL